MEEVIDFDSWLQNYTPPEVEFWAIYDPETSAVIGIYPSFAANDKQKPVQLLEFIRHQLPTTNNLK